MKEINIRGVLNGWIVKVGCSEVVFDDLSEMLREIKKYIENPIEVEKEYLDNKVNKNEELIVTRPFGYDSISFSTTTPGNKI